ncbi:MAG: hypothetical protein NC131_01125 [Roseburia sp.]|nr:hypothetical protein [Roseburia sp.]
MAYPFQNYTNGGYGAYPYVAPYQPQMQQSIQQPNMGQQPVQAQPQMQQNVQQRPVSELPIQGVMFASEDEAKSYILNPNSRVLLINREKGEAYLKSADGLGQTYIEPYTFTKKTAEQVQAEKATKIDTSAFVTKDAAKNFVTTDDLDKLSNKLIKRIERLTDKINNLRSEDNDDE